MEWTTVARGYANLWARMTIRPEHVEDARRIATRINANRSEYEPVSAATGVPWWFVGIIHQMESACDFSTHLHNGDPLTGRTTDVPAGRPVSGSPPFSWIESAVDALQLKELHREHDWSYPRALFLFECYNGLGYYGKINSPYIWSFSNLYTRGKYVSSGKYSATAVSEQCGAAVILRTMIDLKYIPPEVKETTMTQEATQAQQVPDHGLDLGDVLHVIGTVAPTAARLLGGPAAGIAASVIAEVLDTDKAGLGDKLKQTPVSSLLTALDSAEKKLAPLAATAGAAPAPLAASAGAAPATPAVAAAHDEQQRTQDDAAAQPSGAQILAGMSSPAPAETPANTLPGGIQTAMTAMTWFDRLFGSRFVGLKTYGSIGLAAAVNIAYVLGIAPGILTHDNVMAIDVFLGTFGTAAFVSKIERIAGMFKK